jgi:NAD(P)-dependent dehydrogenase (short-subunit alcohol dehydrogenase family)
MAQRNLIGRVAIITGGAMGIGKACARVLGVDGAKVIVADVDIEAGEATCSELTSMGISALFCRCDVTSMIDVEKAVHAGVAAFGGIDVLVNNAARAMGGVVDEIDEDNWNAAISMNLTSVWRCMKAVVPEMKKRGGGSVINMSSVQSFTGFHGWAAYAAAKGGINGLTQQTAVDLAKHKIRVNAIAPGTIMTPMNEKIYREHPDPAALIKRWNESHPLGRFGEAEEVAEAVLFLASERSSFVTGTIIRVDGGFLISGG